MSAQQCFALCVDCWEFHYGISDSNGVFSREAAELIRPQPAPVVLPTVGEVREAVIAGTKLGGWGPHTAAQAVLNLIASRVRHWVPVEPEDPRVAVVNEWLQEPWPPIADLLARLDALEADR